MSRFTLIFGGFLAFFAASCATMQSQNDRASALSNADSHNKTRSPDPILWDVGGDYSALEQQVKSFANLGYGALLVSAPDSSVSEGAFKILIESAHRAGLKVLTSINIENRKGITESKSVDQMRQKLEGLNQWGVDGYSLHGVGLRDADFYPKVLTSDLVGDKVVIAHVAVDSRSYAKDLAPYLQSDVMKLFDFPLRSSISDAFSIAGSLAALVEIHLIDLHRALPGAKAITFVDDPDLLQKPDFKTWALDPVDEQLAFAYVLGRNDGTPLVYSKVDKNTRHELKDEPWLKSLLAFHNLVKDEPLTIVAAETCLIAFQRGTKGFIGINKCNVVRSFSIDGLWAEGTRFQDLFNGREIALNPETSAIEVPPRSFVVFGAK